MTLVEFAVGIVILLFVLLGIIEFAWYTRNHLIIANAVRDGARAAAVGKDLAGINAIITTGVQPLILAPGSVVCEYSADQGVNYRPFPPDLQSTPPLNGAPAGSLVRVTVNTTNRSPTGLPLIGSRPISISVTMVRERS